MKILYVVHQFFPKHYTGTERFVYNLCKQMQKMGHFVKVITYGLSETEGLNTVGNLLVKQYEFEGIPVLAVKHNSIPKTLETHIYNDDLGQFAYELLIREKFDVIHVAHPMRIGSVAVAAMKLKIPTVLTLTDFWIICPRGIAITSEGSLCSDPQKGKKCRKSCFARHVWMWRQIGTFRFKQAKSYIENFDLVTSPTHFLADIFETVLPIKIEVVRHGILYSGIEANERIYEDGNAIVLGYIGTVLPHKGVHLMVKAFKYLNQSNIKLKIYGSYFHEHEYYNHLIEDSEDDGRIEFLDKYEDEDLGRIMRSIDCTLAPSVWWENSPLTVLTSFAYKVPVITINIGGAAELVKDGVNGLNFKIGDAEDLARKIELIAKNPTILNDLKKNIKRPPRVEDEAFNYETIYRGLIDSKIL
jgi:glycosyltransferase involved in cell wall biosynthesis